MPSLFQWIVIAVIISAIFLFVKFKYIKHKLSWIIVLALVLMFYVGFLASTSGQNLDLGSYEGSQTAIRLYFGWLGNSFDNIKTLTGQAINLDWQTNSTG